MSAAGLIGPNAVTRVAEVLPPLVGSSATRALFEQAGLLNHLLDPPEAMVDEDDVRRLHAALRESLGAQTAATVARRAGQRTADYLLAHRIPGAAQAVLRALPARAAARLLLKAVSRHAWTFAGSGEFAYTVGRPVVLTIRHNPLCRELHSAVPACDYYAAVFERLFRALVHRDARVREVACEACGDPACVFELTW
jgi:divinyl protochlorophyllide a 8-vinyl-reductase